jgi:hypothetical protein
MLATAPAKEKKILKAAREKLLITYKGTPKILTADFSTEAMEDQAEGYSQCSKKCVSQETFIHQICLSKLKAR